MSGSADGDRADALRHGCWLVFLIGGISALVLVVVGTIGLVGPVELTLIVAIVAIAVIAGDRWAQRRAGSSADREVST